MKTDAQSKSAILDEFRWEPSISSGNMDVATKVGIVTLSGTVPHSTETLAAEKAVQRVEGVTAIVEELEVSLSGVHKRQDSEIEEAVASSLMWHVWGPGEIQSTIQNGWVTLSGKTRSWHEQEAATTSWSTPSSLRAKTIWQSLTKPLFTDPSVRRTHRARVVVTNSRSCSAFMNRVLFAPAAIDFNAASTEDVAKFIARESRLFK